MVLAAAGLGHAREMRYRVRAAKPYLARLDPRVVPAIDRDAGYGMLTADRLQLGPVIDVCRHLFEIKKAALDARFEGLEGWSPERKEKYLARKQSFLRYLLDDEDLRNHPEIVDFALSDAALGAATRYLGMVPLLTRVDLMYSLPRDAGDNIASQLFHLDHEGVHQLKIFINLFDVDEPQGPFTFIPADVSSRVMREVRALRRKSGSSDKVESRRYTDEEVAAVGGTEAMIAAKGPAGSGVAVDTSRCLHLGSRVDPGTFRLCLYLQYCTTRELTNVFDVNRFKNDPVKHLAVAHSIEPGRGRAAEYTREMLAQ